MIRWKKTILNYVTFNKLLSFSANVLKNVKENSPVLTSEWIVMNEELSGFSQNRFQWTWKLFRVQNFLMKKNEILLINFSITNTN